MRVDRKARDMMIRAIVKYMNGQTKSFSFSDEIAEADCLAEDQDVHNIRLALWMSYDDIKDHTVSVSQDGWEAYRRAIAYLMTDLVAPPDFRFDSESETWWPRSASSCCVTVITWAGAPGLSFGRPVVLSCRCRSASIGFRLAVACGTQLPSSKLSLCHWLRNGVWHLEFTCRNANCTA